MEEMEIQEDFFNDKNENHVYFLFTSHGFSVGKYNTKIEVDITDPQNADIEEIQFFANHNEILYAMEIEGEGAIIDDKLNYNYLNKLINLPKEIYVYTERRSNKKRFLLPPVGFISTMDDLKNVLYKNMMGLRYYNKSTGWVELLSITNLIDYGGPITYSIILNKIKKIIENDVFFNGKKIYIGFFSCRSFDETYKHEYFYNYENVTYDFKKLYPSVRNNILSIENPEIYDRPFVPLLIKTKFSNVLPHNNHSRILTSVNWTRALGGILYQGCALNVLSLYGFIIQALAREYVFCLTDKGMSIFRIIDFLHSYLIKRCYLYKEKSIDIGDINKNIILTWLSNANPIEMEYSCYPDNTLYTVLRYETNIKDKDACINSFKILFNYLFLYDYIDSCMLIVKFYKNIFHQNMFSQKGHTVSFYFRKLMINSQLLYQVYLIDPQANIDFIIYQNNEIHDFFINYLKEGKYECYDLIWYNSTEITIKSPVCVLKPQTDYYVLNEIYLENKLITSFISFNVPYDDKITYGGNLYTPSHNVDMKRYKGRGKKANVPEDIAIIDKIPENKDEINENALDEYIPISVEIQRSSKSKTMSRSRSKTRSKSKSRSRSKSKSKTYKLLTP